MGRGKALSPKKEGAYMQERQITAMKNLGMSEKEIAELIEYDRKVDRGEKTEYDLTEEQKQIVKAITRVSKLRETPTIRTKTIDNVKKNIVESICNFLTNQQDLGLENIQIINVDREISFNVGDVSYGLTLIKHKKK